MNITPDDPQLQTTAATRALLLSPVFIAMCLIAWSVLQAFLLEIHS